MKTLHTDRISRTRRSAARPHGRASLPAAHLPVVAAAIALFCLSVQRGPSRSARDLTAPPLLPWQSVGGCGAGGSGDGQCAFHSPPLWADRLHSPFRLHVQSIWRRDFAHDFAAQELAMRMTGFVNRWVLLGISAPLKSSRGTVQAHQHLVPYDATGGGIGDVSVDATAILLATNPVALQLGLQFPTGAYALARGRQNEEQNLPSRLQPGSGLHALIVALRHERSLFGRGQWGFSGRCVFPFALRLSSGKNEFLHTRFAHHAGETDNSRFYYRFKPYGENDLGRYIPAHAILTATYSHPSDDKFHHSAVVRLSIPFGVHWQPSHIATHYDPYPDPNHRAWTSTWVYMPEYRMDALSLMGFIAVPLSDSPNGSNPADRYDDTPFSRLDGPDWREFPRQSSFGLGFRYGMGNSADR